MDATCAGQRTMMQQLNDRPSETWIVPFRTSGMKPPLFCVCSGGGDVLDYRDLADALPHDQPVYAFGIPTLDRTAQFPTVEQLASIYLEKIRELQFRGPYHLCGHSFGGIVVYEIARQLAAKGLEVRLLALLDTQHPRLVQNFEFWQKLHFHSIYMRDRTYKYISNILKFKFNKIIADAKKFAKKTAKPISLKTYQWLFSKPRRLFPNEIPNDTMILEAAWHRYVPGPYNGPVLLLNARERTAEYKVDQTLGWRRCVTGPITVQIVPGDHLTIMHPPQVETLATLLKTHLAPDAAMECSREASAHVH